MQTSSGSPFLPYTAFINGDFATTKGVELMFKVRRFKRFQVNASLSFQDAQGSGSFPNSNRALVLAGLNTAYVPQYISPLSFNNAVRGSINVDYRFEHGDAGPFLQDLGASLLFIFNSGHPYTRITNFSVEYDATQRFPDESLNASSTSWVFQCDLRLDKTFQIADGVKANLYLFVINLFDTKNVLNVFMKTGSADDDGFLSDPTQGAQLVKTYGNTFANLYRALKIDYARPIGYYNDPYFYGPPRQVRLGLRLEY
jgi:hypothetical protein